MRDATLALIIKGNQILLGMKKRAFGKDKYNGFGGKVLENESIEQAAIRETFEESKIKIRIEDMVKVAEIEFYFPESKSDWNQIVHIYSVSNYEGIPEESEEMTVQWFEIDKVPYSQMWETDSHWLPLILSGKKIKAVFHFAEDCSTTKSFDYQEVDKF